MRSEPYQITAVNNPSWRPYLLDALGNSYSKRIVKYQGSYWFVKCMPYHTEPAKRERLAYLLGRNLANIAEVRLLSNIEIEAIHSSGVEMPEAATPTDTYLIRLGFDYSWWQLPIKSLDRAMAAELVFSLWVRRRDAHSFNRVYVRGIPIFFDHLTALLGEPELADLDKYFYQGPDAGYPAWWQLEEMSLFSYPNLLEMRSNENQAFAMRSRAGKVSCLVKKKKNMRKLLNQAAQKICEVSPSYLRTKATEAGFDKTTSESITEFLLYSARNLNHGVEKLCRMFNLS